MEELLAIAVPLEGFMNVEVQDTQGFHFIVSAVAVLEERGRRLDRLVCV